MDIMCNPVSVNYPYSFIRDPRFGSVLSVNREAADPSMVLFKGKYYIFASMTSSVWVSEDMAHWDNCPLPDCLPAYDYAPDVCVMGDWLYFTASNRGVPCDFYRTQDPVNGPYERIEGTFDFWDPDMFEDEDGRVYLYWGCANSTPIWGVELDRVSLKPVGEARELICGDPLSKGYERFGEDHCESPEEGIEGWPYIEGAWMTKYEGNYYLQYACPGTELNIYADGVYVSDSPLGPFEPAENNPYSYKPGGFLPGAGHGSTMCDLNGNLWHTATMRISANHVFERRVGIWPAGFDSDGELFCNQRYGDWPYSVEKLRKDPWTEPEWMLLSYGKRAYSSSCCAGHEAEYAVDENVQTWWRAADSVRDQWLCVDLGRIMTVNAVHINFADDPEAEISCPGELVQCPDSKRYIDTAEHYTRWMLEASADGEEWAVLEDRREAEDDLCHYLSLTEKGISTRYIRLTVAEVPYGVSPCVSGLRVFGKGNSKAPAKPAASAMRTGDRDMLVSAVEMENVQGYNILWGHREDKLYHSYLVMGKGIDEKRIGALVKGQEYFVRVDAFNESGITKGDIISL